MLAAPLPTLATAAAPEQHALPLPAASQSPLSHADAPLLDPAAVPSELEQIDRRLQALLGDAAAVPPSPLPQPVAPDAARRGLSLSRDDEAATRRARAPSPMQDAAPPSASERELVDEPRTLFDEMKRRLSEQGGAAAPRLGARPAERVTPQSKLVRDRRARRERSGGGGGGGVGGGGSGGGAQETRQRLAGRRFSSSSGLPFQRSRSPQTAGGGRREDGGGSADFQALLREYGKHKEQGTVSDADDDGSHTQTTQEDVIVKTSAAAPSADLLLVKVQELERENQRIRDEIRRLRTVESEAIERTKAQRQREEEAQEAEQKRELEVTMLRRQSTFLEHKSKELQHELLERDRRHEEELRSLRARAEAAAKLEAELKSREAVIGELCQRIKDGEGAQYSLLSKQIRELQEEVGVDGASDRRARGGCCSGGSSKKKKKARGCCGL